MVKVIVELKYTTAMKTEEKENFFLLIFYDLRFIIFLLSLTRGMYFSRSLIFVVYDFSCVKKAKF